jgi:hypothetical protein
MDILEECRTDYGFRRPGHRQEDLPVARVSLVLTIVDNAEATDEE